MATKRKMRRFDAGGVTDEDLYAANATEDPIAALNALKKRTGSDEETPKQTFGQAFAAAPKVASKPAAAPAPAPAEKYETSFDRMNRKNRGIIDTSNLDSNTLLPNKMAKGGTIRSASSRADGIAQRGKTRGTFAKHGK